MRVTAWYLIDVESVETTYFESIMWFRRSIGLLFATVNFCLIHHYLAFTFVSGVFIAVLSCWRYIRLNADCNLCCTCLEVIVQRCAFTMCCVHAFSIQDMTTFVIPLTWVIIVTNAITLSYDNSLQRSVGKRCRHLSWRTPLNSSIV